MERREFQIHDGTFGRALYERATAEEALLDYFADRRRGELRGKVKTREDGVAFVEVDGVTYEAVPMQKEVEVG